MKKKLLKVKSGSLISRGLASLMNWHGLNVRMKCCCIITEAPEIVQFWPRGDKKEHMTRINILT